MIGHECVTYDDRSQFAFYITRQSSLVINQWLIAATNGHRCYRQAASTPMEGLSPFNDHPMQYLGQAQISALEQHQGVFAARGLQNLNNEQWDQIDRKQFAILFRIANKLSNHLGEDELDARELIDNDGKVLTTNW